MDIRNGKYLDQNQQIMPELYDLINDYEKRLDYAKINTELPDQPDYNKVHDLLFEINAKTVSIQGDLYGEFDKQTASYNYINYARRFT